MSAEQNKKTLREFYEWMSGGDPAEIGTYMRDDFIDHDPFVNPQGDHEGMRQAVHGLQSAFPDLSITVEEMVAEGDTIAARFTARGTQQGQFMDMPPSGKSFEVTGLDVVHFREGKMAEHWGQIDQLGLLRQLGAMPA